MEAADPEHSQDFREPDLLDQVVADGQNLVGSRPFEGLDQDRHESTNGWGLDRDVGVELNHPIGADLNEEVDRGLALLNPVCHIFICGKFFGKRRQGFGEVDQHLDPLLAVGAPEFARDSV